MTRRTLAVITTLAVAAGAGSTAAPAAAAGPYPAAWHWATMGDHKRTIVLADAAPGSDRMRVGPCQFRALWLAGAIDRKRTPAMRGDGYARGVIRCTGGPLNGGRDTGR